MFKFSNTSFFILLIHTYMTQIIMCKYMCVFFDSLFFMIMTHAALSHLKIINDYIFLQQPIMNPQKIYLIFTWTIRKGKFKVVQTDALYFVCSSTFLKYFIFVAIFSFCCSIFYASSCFLCIVTFCLMSVLKQECFNDHMPTLSCN